MKRTEWEFMFNAPDMMVAANRKQEYHEGRVEFWSNELEKAEADQKSNEEQFNGVPTKMNSSYSNMQSHAETRVRDCKMKVIEHTRHVEEFKRWGELFANSHETREFPLSYDDVEFFDIIRVAYA
jgi:hypothetical protein